jgi:DNA-binding transcriptional regulator YhcF (GntR family)
MAHAVDTSSPFAVDPDDELPVGLQLTLRLRALISTGRLGPGEKLPSVRQLAGWAGINLNTVRAVYAKLEEEALVATQQGRGTFVATDVDAAPLLEEIVEEAMLKAKAAGVTARDLAEVALAWASIQGAAAVPPTDQEAASGLAEAEVIEVRAELRRQIGKLEAELAEYARDIPATARTAPRFAVAHVAGVEELEQTRDTLVARLSEARLAREQRIRAEARQRSLGERSEEDAVGPLARAMGWWREKP